MVQRRECEERQLVGCVQSRYFLDLRDAFFMLAFFFSVVRFLEAIFLATFFFVRELGFFAPITVATLLQTSRKPQPGAAVTPRSSSMGKLANIALVPSAAVFPAATTVSCALAALSRTAGTAVAVAVAAEAALATSPARALARLAALFPAATIVSCALVMMLLRVILHSPAQRTRRNIVRVTISVWKWSGACAGSTQMSALGQKRTCAVH